MLTSETKRRLDACRDLLVGQLPLPTDQVELITLALIYKFMDDIDEESVAMGGKRSFFTGPLAKYRWRALLPQTVSGDQRVALFSEGVEAIGSAKTGAHLPELFRHIFRNAFLKFRDGRILTLFLTEVIRSVANTALPRAPCAPRAMGWAFVTRICRSWGSRPPSAKI